MIQFNRKYTINGIQLLDLMILNMVTFNAKVNSILPSTNASSDTDSNGLDIGAADENFRVVYAKKFEGALLGNSNTASKLNPGAAINLIGDVNATMTTPFTGNGDYNIIGIALTTTDVAQGEYPNADVGLVPTFTQLIQKEDCNGR